MLLNTHRCSCGVLALLRRSAQFLGGLVDGVVHHSSLPSVLSFGLLSFRGPCRGDNSVRDRWIEDALCRGAAAHCLLDTAPLAADVQASLTAALFAKPQWNNSVTHVMESNSLASLEKDVTDKVAALLHLPSRFFWLPPEEGRKQLLSEAFAQTHPSFLNSLVLDRNTPPASGTVSSNSGSNMSSGCGLLHDTLLESLVVLFVTARAQVYARYLSARFSSPEDEARLTQRLVLYCTDQCQPLLKRAARCVGIQHIRVLQTVYAPAVHNYPMQVDMLKARLAEDIAHGLCPLLVCGVFGSQITGSVDPLDELADLCRRLKVWFHIDASHSGLSLATSDTPEQGIAGEREHSALVEAWKQHVSSFRSAALLADSIHIGISTSFLPTLSVVSSASLLFVADVAKVAVALQQMNGDDEAGGNVWCTPAATDVSRLQVGHSSLRSNEIIRLAISLARCDSVGVTQTVWSHQAALHYMEQRLRADGRFDCSVHASCFGMVLFRWLTLADEVTEALMRRWSTLLASFHNGRDETEDRGGSRFPRVSVGLTRIHRRLFICVGLAAGGGGDSVGPRHVDLVVESLLQAAALEERLLGESSVLLR